MNIYKRTIHKVRQEGLIKSSQKAFTKCYDYFFDFKFNLDTCSWVAKENLIGEKDVNEHAVLYQGQKVLPLRKLLSKLKFSHNNVFVDIGSGKGRVLILAAEYGFKEVRGIEFSTELCKISESNWSIYKNKSKTKSILNVFNVDASKYIFKDDETVFFLYNPFDEFILERVFKNLLNSLKQCKRKIIIIYSNPVHKKFFERELPIQNIKDISFWGTDFAVYEV